MNVQFVDAAFVASTAYSSHPGGSVGSGAQQAAVLGAIAASTFPFDLSPVTVYFTFCSEAQLAGSHHADLATTFADTTTFMSPGAITAGADALIRVWDKLDDFAYLASHGLGQFASLAFFNETIIHELGHVFTGALTTDQQATLDGYFGVPAWQDDGVGVDTWASHGAEDAAETFKDIFYPARAFDNRTGHLIPREDFQSFLDILATALPGPTTSFGPDEDLGTATWDPGYQIEAFDPAPAFLGSNFSMLGPDGYAIFHDTPGAVEFVPRNVVYWSADDPYGTQELTDGYWRKTVIAEDGISAFYELDWTALFPGGVDLVSLSAVVDYDVSNQSMGGNNLGLQPIRFGFAPPGDGRTPLQILYESGPPRGGVTRANLVDTSLSPDSGSGTWWRWTGGHFLYNGTGWQWVPVDDPGGLDLGRRKLLSGEGANTDDLAIFPDPVTPGAEGPVGGHYEAVAWACVDRHFRIAYDVLMGPSYQLGDVGVETLYPPPRVVTGWEGLYASGVSLGNVQVIAHGWKHTSVQGSGPGLDPPWPYPAPGTVDLGPHTYGVHRVGRVL